MNTDIRGNTRAIVVYSILFLFFFQLISHFIAGIYGFGVLGTGLPVELGAIILFLSPFLLLFFKKGLSRTTVVVIAELFLLFRAVEVWLDLRPQLLVAALGTGIFLFLFPALLWRHGRSKEYGAGRLMAVALVLAIAVSILLRTLGLTMDLSNEGWFRVIAIALAIGAGLLIPGTLSKEPSSAEGDEEPESTAGFGKATVLGLGVISVFLMLYFAFSGPAVIARWTGVDYLLILAVSSVALVGFSWLLALDVFPTSRLTVRLAIIGSAIFVLALSALLAINQVVLPADPSAYPLLDPEPGSLWIVALFAILLLFPILSIDFGLFAEETIRTFPSMRKLGFGFGIASIFMMIMILAHVFTSTWAYIDPIIEPLFRGRFWQIHLLVGIVLILSLLIVRKSALGSDPVENGGRARKSAAVLVTVISAIVVVGAIILQPNASNAEPKEQLAIAGYNLQQGYGQNLERSHKEQCEVLREIDADVVVLSENDTARIAGGNFDIAHYLAACLEMYSYAGPKTGIGSFGYAILSKYPIENPETFHLFSDHGLPSTDDPEKVSGGDQVALLKGEISAGGEIYNIIAVHSDSNPPKEQFTGLVEIASRLENVVAVGDYNCRPGNECFSIVDEVLDHCTQSSGDVSVINGRIDHIFVSPGLSCQEYTYVESEASDHPVVVSKIGK